MGRVEQAGPSYGNRFLSVRVLGISDDQSAQTESLSSSKEACSDWMTCESTDVTQSEVAKMLESVKVANPPYFFSIWPRQNSDPSVQTDQISTKLEDQGQDGEATANKSTNI